MKRRPRATGPRGLSDLRPIPFFAAFGALLCLGSTAASGSCSASSETLCLQNERFALSLDWHRDGGPSGTGQVASFQSKESGLFTFFDDANWEMLAKVVDGCSLNGYYWVFAAVSTTVGYDLLVVDTASGRRKTYSEDAGGLSQTQVDTQFFACDLSSGSNLSGSSLSGSFVEPLRSEDLGDTEWNARTQVTSPLGLCLSSANALCFAERRFQLEVEWTDFLDVKGPAKVVEIPAVLRSDSSGLLYFFSPDNWEMLVKVLDGCDMNNRYWVFAAATTTVAFTLTVTDTLSGEQKKYQNERGTPAKSIADTDAFSCSAPSLDPPVIQPTTDRSVVLGQKGDQATVSVEVVDTNGQPVEGALVDWSSSAPDLVSVTPSGSLSAVVRAESDASGSAKITGSFQGNEKSIAVALADVAANAALLDNGSVMSQTPPTDTQPGSLTLAKTPATTGLKAGAILISGEQAGVLARVVTVREDDNTVTLGVVAASLADAFEELSLETTEGPLLTGGSLVSENPAGSDGQTANCVDATGQPVDATLTGGEVTAQQRFESTASLDVESSVVEKLRVTVKTLLELTTQPGELDIGAGVDGFLECIVKLPATPLTIAQGPVLWQFTAIPTVGVQAEVPSDTKSRTLAFASSTSNGEVEQGIAYDSSTGWTLVNEQQWDGEASPPSAAPLGSPSAKVEPVTRLELTLRGAVGKAALGSALDIPFARQNAESSLEIDLSSPTETSSADYRGPVWEASLTASGGLEPEVFGAEVRQLTELLGVDQPIATPSAPFGLDRSLAKSPSLAVTGPATFDGSAGNTGGDFLVSADSTVTGTVDLWAAPAGTGELTIIASSPISNANTVSINWTPSGIEGTYDVYPRLMSDDLSNNSPYASSVPATVEITGQGADLVAALNDLDPTNPVELEPVTLSGTICNQGTFPTGPFEWRLLVNFDVVDSGFPTSLSSTPPDNCIQAPAIEWTDRLNQGSYSIELIADFGNAVEETNTANNRATRDFIVGPKAGPDLIFDGAPTPSATLLQSEQVFTLSANLKNQGPAASLASLVRYLVSTDGTIDVGDSLLATANVDGLLRDTSVMLTSADLQAPMAPGIYYVGVCVDAVPNEENTVNNCSRGVRVLVGADLVTSVAGSTATVRATVSNQGAVSTTTPTIVRYYCSADATITTADLVFGSPVTVGAVTLTTPFVDNTGAAPFPTCNSVGSAVWIGACVATVPEEGDSTNNCSSSLVATSSDLVVSAAASGSFAVSATVTNLGPAASTSTTTLSYYCSADATITTDDILFGTQPTVNVLASGASQTLPAQSANTAACTVLGRSFWAGACVAAVPEESDTTNNCSLGQVLSIPADLSVSSSVAGAVVSADVTNLGPATTTAQTTLTYYCSGDATISPADSPLGTATVNPLIVGATQTISGQSANTATCNGLGSPFWAGACITPLPEDSNTANDCSAGQPVLIPDLVATATVTGSSVSASVMNQGTGPTTVATTQRFYCSADATITTGDIAFGAAAAVPVLTAGASQPIAAQSANTAACNGLATPPGTVFWAGACVVSLPEESNQNNNCSAGQAVLIPDLVATAAATGFSVSAAVTNQGSGSTTAVTTVTYYCSADPTISPADTSFGAPVNVGVLASGSSQAIAPQSASTPACTGLGASFWAGVCVVALPEESNQNNNCSTGQVVP